MKSRKIFFITAVIVLAIAFFTKPGMTDFKEFIREKSPVPPVISYANGFVYSVFSVTYYDTQKIPAANAPDSLKTIAVAGEKATYLGLFGRFWKI